MTGWVLLKDAPLETIGYVYSPDKSWAKRTDIVGQVFEGAKGTRFVSSSAKGFDFTHWHPLLDPPN